jgi:hypothetical protein
VPSSEKLHPGAALNASSPVIVRRRRLHRPLPPRNRIRGAGSNLGTTLGSTLVHLTRVVVALVRVIRWRSRNRVVCLLPPEPPRSSRRLARALSRHQLGRPPREAADSDPPSTPCASPSRPEGLAVRPEEPLGPSQAAQLPADPASSSQCPTLSLVQVADFFAWGALTVQ